MCDKPRRNRRNDVWPFLPIHLFAMWCVAVRIYSKSLIIRSFSLDDWIITVTYFIYLFYIDSCLYLLILGLARTSILCFYLRLFPYERFCRLCYALLTIVATTTVLFIVLAMTQCMPISYNWEGWKGDFGPVKCLNLNLLSWSTSAIGIALDTTILIIPLPLVVKVKSTLRRKLYIISMFSLGIMNVISSSIRLRYNIMYGDSINITWDYVDLMIWTGVEVSTSVAVTSLPSIRLMLHRLFPGVFGRIFAFGGHVEQDRERYLKSEAQNLDVEALSAKGITRRARRSRLGDNPPPTIGGGAPSDLNHRRRTRIALDEDMKAPTVPARTEASRILASIMSTRSRSPSTPTQLTNDNTITVTTEISVTSKRKAASGDSSINDSGSDV
ncbi:hypothetical protein LY76DRAFT_583776 [Colletotrichum caudatum]|nr:hypothetical protein LY76DRAFT_583776 [Colletotrichum caudatum]